MSPGHLMPWYNSDSKMSAFSLSWHVSACFTWCGKLLKSIGGPSKVEGMPQHISFKHCHIVYHYRQPQISTVTEESSCMGDSRDEYRKTLIWTNRWEVGASEGTCSASGHEVPQPAWCLCDITNIFVADPINTLSYFTWKLNLFHRFKPSLWFSCRK